MWSSPNTVFADLRGRLDRQRGLALCDIAAPEHRDRLRHQFLSGDGVNQLTAEGFDLFGQRQKVAGLF